MFGATFSSFAVKIGSISRLETEGGHEKVRPLEELDRVRVAVKITVGGQDGDELILHQRYPRKSLAQLRLIAHHRAVKLLVPYCRGHLVHVIDREETCVSGQSSLNAERISGIQLRAMLENEPSRSAEPVLSRS